MTITYRCPDPTDPIALTVRYITLVLSPSAESQDYSAIPDSWSRARAFRAAIQLSDEKINNLLDTVVALPDLDDSVVQLGGHWEGTLE